MTVKKRKKRMVYVVCCVIFAILCAAGLLTIKKIRAAGGFQYLYNTKHPTRGELLTEYNAQAAAGADGTVMAVSDTAPKQLGITQRLRFEEDGVTICETNKQDYMRKYPVSFDGTQVLGSVDGIFTFRGNYYRNLSSYGTAVIDKEKFAKGFWTVQTGKLLKSNGRDYWSGNGWTGQPLIVRWDRETRQIMNLYPEKKAKEGFTEVIYSGMDGYIHFLDLEDGSRSRDEIHIGMVFKGTASLHPEGIPLLVLGSGDSQPGMYGENVSPRAYIYSLIDGTRLYEFGMNDEFAPRTFHAFDSSPVIDAKTDTLFYPAENGVLYTMRLNTAYDAKAGTLSIAPEEFLDYTYSTERASENAFTWGMENSAVVHGNFLYVGDNGGVFYCLNLNTMQMVWAQDLYADVNSSPIYSEEEDGDFIYTATTLTEATVDEHFIGNAAVFKLNAATGQIVWKKEFECHNVDGVEGGILATGVLGQNAIAGQVIYSVARSPKLSSGILISLDTRTGETVWKQELPRYAWSSTVTMYTADGRAYLIQCLADGTVLLMNAANGYILDELKLEATLEATPAVFGNTIVLGTRDRRIVGITVE